MLRFDANLGRLQLKRTSLMSRKATQQESRKPVAFINHRNRSQRIVRLVRSSGCRVARPAVAKHTINPEGAKPQSSGQGVHRAVAARVSISSSWSAPPAVIGL